MKLEKHLFLSDFHIPDHNRLALLAVYKFIKDFKPDYLWLVGDILNFTQASKYPVVENLPSLGEEIKIARSILTTLLDKSRDANRKVIITWLEGNHCERLQKDMARKAKELMDIEDEEGEAYISVPDIFHLKDLGVEWVPFNDIKVIHGIGIEHGDSVRIKAGHTAQAMIDKRGRSGVSGHTHRVSLVSRNQGGNLKWWMEIGCLCNLNPTPHYVKEPDWSGGIGIGLYDPKDDVMYPTPVLLINNKFLYNGKVYSA